MLWLRLGPRSLLRVTAVAVLLAGGALFCANGYLEWRGRPAQSHAVSPPFFIPGPGALYNASTNPLSEDSDLVYGPWDATVPALVHVDIEFSVTLSCNHPNESYCPPAYYIQYYGPTAGAVPLTASERVSTREVASVIKLSEPGEYQIYAWPNDPDCGRADKEGVIPLFRKTVQGSPFHVQVLGTPSRIDGYRSCHNLSEILDGRWLRYENVDPSLRSRYDLGHYYPTPEAAAQFGLQQQRAQHARYIYVPYTCKIPHRTAVDMIDALPSAKHILFIGDSVARNYVCARVFTDLWGANNLGVCAYRPDSPVWEHGNKQARWRDPETDRAVDLTFAFAHKDVRELFPFFDELEQPEHVVFNMGLWIDGYDDAQFKAQYDAFFEYVDRNWEGAHVVVRSTTSVVQPVQCFQQGGHSRENAGRMRRLALDAAVQWQERLQNEGKRTKVSFVDAFAATDSRPETTVDGLHWMYHEPRQTASEWLRFELSMRPLAGEAEDLLLDWMWDEVVSGRSMGRN